MIIDLSAQILQISSHTLIHLPKSVSAKLPSRGMVYVKGMLNDKPISVPLEPDGKGSHWFEVKGRAGEKAHLSLEALDEWPEPQVPIDVKRALADLQNEWKDITTKARWDWLRWIRSTKNLETRKKRIGVMLSKLESGNRRPCCFNRNMCTITDVSTSGVLRDH